MEREISDAPFNEVFDTINADSTHFNCTINSKFIQSLIDAGYTEILHTVPYPVVDEWNRRDPMFRGVAPTAIAKTGFIYHEGKDVYYNVIMQNIDGSNLDVCIDKKQFEEKVSLKEG